MTATTDTHTGTHELKRVLRLGDLVLFNVVGKHAATVTAPIILAFAAAGVLAAVLQTPPVPIFKRVMPELSRVSPTQGWKRMFSMKGLFEFVKLWKNQPHRELPFRFGYPDNAKHNHLMITRPKAGA